MSKTSKVAMAVALAVAGSATAQGQSAVSGELRDVKGSVMVLKGKDYVTGAAGMALAAGERVLVLERAQAKVLVVSGGDRCEIELKDNQALTIAPQGCKALVASVQTVPSGGAPGAAAVAAGASSNASTSAAATAGAVWLGGAAAIGGGAFLTQRNKASND